MRRLCANAFLYSRETSNATVLSFLRKLDEAKGILTSSKPLVPKWEKCLAVSRVESSRSGLSIDKSVGLRWGWGWGGRTYSLLFRSAGSVLSQAGVGHLRMAHKDHVARRHIHPSTHRAWLGGIVFFSVTSFVALDFSAFVAESF